MKPSDCAETTQEAAQARALDTTQAGALQAVTDEQIEAAAKIMGECWQTPWDRIHERGRDHIRKHAKAVADVFAATQPNAAPAAEVVASDEQRDTFETYMVGTLKFPVGRSELTGSYKDSTTRMCWHVWRKALALAAPAAAIDAREQEVEWGDPKTVGMFVRQLQTIAPETPIHAAVHTDLDGKRVALTKPVTISRERVQGRHIRQGDQSVPYSIVVWASHDESPEARPNAAGQEPIDMVLHCPRCGLQHVDAPEPPPHPCEDDVWTNPPHKSHLCHRCSHIWRPADVPTNGVRAVKTTGKADSPLEAVGSSGMTADQAQGDKT